MSCCARSSIAVPERYKLLLSTLCKWSAKGANSFMPHSVCYALLPCLMLPLLPLQTRCIGSARRSTTGAGRSSWSCPKCWKASLSPTPLSSRLRFRSSGVFVSGLNCTQPHGPGQPVATVCHHLAPLLKARLSDATDQKSVSNATSVVLVRSTASG